MAGRRWPCGKCGACARCEKRLRWLASTAGELRWREKVAAEAAALGFVRGAVAVLERAQVSAKKGEGSSLPARPAEANDRGEALSDLEVAD